MINKTIKPMDEEERQRAKVREETNKNINKLREGINQSVDTTDIDEGANNG